ncbi:Hypothetical predicted protein [Pelobates cultripes]|uniref:Uncharacterized protein n=1 Tax=Pelobates cultripes TaxID=61616 RepID=A0AAD1W7V4_PELCU|nr:Hypothetical predicted protein [Pelobates cultripes]
MGPRKEEGSVSLQDGESKTRSTTQVIPVSRPDTSGAPATGRTQHEHSGEQLSWIPQRTVTQAGPPQARLPTNMEHREPAWADTAGFKLQTQMLSGATKPEKPTMQRLCFTAAGHRLNGDQDFISDMGNYSAWKAKLDGSSWIALDASDWTRGNLGGTQEQSLTPPSPIGKASDCELTGQEGPGTCDVAGCSYTGPADGCQKGLKGLLSQGYSIYKTWYTQNLVFPHLPPSPARSPPSFSMSLFLSVSLPLSLPPVSMVPPIFLVPD